MSESPKLGRVVWSTNEMISIPHFFLTERYMESMINSRIMNLCNFSWGFEEIVLDISEIRSGKLGLKIAKGFMPDGTPIDIPNSDSQIDFVHISIEKFNKNSELFLHLALPISSLRNSIESYYSDGRYKRNSVLIDGVSCSLASHNFKLLIGSEDLSKYTSLPIAKINQVSSTGALQLNTSFIPPCINILKNDFVRKAMIELHSFIKQKARQIAVLFQDSNSSRVPAQITDTLLLQILNRYDAYFQTALNSPSVHPENFYTEMVMFSAEMSTYTSRDKSCIEFNGYSHSNFELNLTEIINQLKHQLDVTIERDATEIRLNRNAYGIYLSEFIPDELLSSSHYILYVNSKKPFEEILKHFPGQCKISARSQLDKHIVGMSTAIYIEHLATLPPSIPYRHNYVSFQFQPREDTMDAMQQIIIEKSLAIHVTGDYPELDIQLWIVKNEKMNG